MGKYDSIINMPHHEPVTRPRMAAENRAAQFAPFAALTGYEDAVDETARLTEQKRELSEEETADLNRTIAWIEEHIESRPKITLTYFVADSRKDGGTYVTAEGRVRRIDSACRQLVFTDGQMVRIEDIRDIEANELNMARQEHL